VIADHFVIVGAQRCGTTYLTQLLDEHPEIEMAKPLRPEPKFFLDYEQFARGAEFYEARYFSDTDARLRGEKSTSYIEHDVAVRRIVALFPNVTIVAVVRDPVARAVSNHRFSTAEGVETLPLIDALRADAADRPWDRERFSVSPYEYLARGCYADALARVGRHVSREQLHVLLFEELVSDPSVLAALYERLGVDRGFRPQSFGTPVNVSSDQAVVDTDAEAWLRNYYAEPNRRLEEFLGRALPWAQAAGVR
jgi:Sulfotransferase family